jgi:hypothetical protein
MGVREHLGRGSRELRASFVVVSLIGFVLISLHPGAAGQAGDGVTAAGRIFAIRAGLHGETTLEEDHFTYAVKAGTTVLDSVEVINFRDQTLDARVYPADMLTAKGGGLSPAQEYSPRKRVGAWIGMEYADISVEPNQTMEIPFSISVPKGIVPGEYIGAVVAAVRGGTNASGIALETRAALLVRVRVPGKVDLGVEVGQLRSSDTDGGRRFDVVVRNTGNVLFTMNGAVRLQSGGETIGTVKLEPAGIYVIPDGEAEFHGTWKDVPRFGRVKAQAVANVALNDEPSGEFLSRALWMTLVPLRFVVGAFALIGAAALGARLTRSRRRLRKQVRDEARRIVAERAAGDTSEISSTDESDAHVAAF